MVKYGVPPKGSSGMYRNMSQGNLRHNTQGGGRCEMLIGDSVEAMKTEVD
jgi:hypothetical protein